MVFKANFLLRIVVEVLWFALQRCFIAVLCRHMENIAIWKNWNVVPMMGTSNFIHQIFSAIFLGNIKQISEPLRTGRLDFMMLLPINTRFLISKLDSWAPLALLIGLSLV